MNRRNFLSTTLVIGAGVAVAKSELNADTLMSNDSTPNDSTPNDSMPNDSTPNDSTPNDSTPNDSNEGILTIYDGDRVVIRAPITTVDRPSFIITQSEPDSPFERGWNYWDISGPGALILGMDELASQFLDEDKTHYKLVILLPDATWQFDEFVVATSDDHPNGVTLLFRDAFVVNHLKCWNEDISKMI